MTGGTCRFLQRLPHPKLSTLDAEMLGLRREIVSFTTYFSEANQARVNNIRQVASILDGMIVRPGATFSFNESVGPRTKAAGFDEAPVIRDGVLTPGVGGGICQVSTTLFNAAFFAGLPVVERRPHSFYIDHYPVGRDATVSYGAVDLKFRNDSDKVILISVQATDRSVRVSLAAPTWDRKVTYTATSFHDVVPPASSEQKPRRLRDPALAAGPNIRGRSRRRRADSRSRPHGDPGGRHPAIHRHLRERLRAQGLRGAGGGVDKRVTAGIRGPPSGRLEGAPVWFGFCSVSFVRSWQ